MAIYVAKRIGYSLITLVLVSFTVFFLIHLIPGDPALDPARLARHAGVGRAPPARARAHRSLVTQYRIFMANLLHGDLGTSLRYQTPVFGLVFERLRATLFLILYSEVLTLLVALPLGMVAALKREKLADHTIRVVVVVAMAIPTFWIGTLLILLFSLHWTGLPVGGLRQRRSGSTCRRSSSRRSRCRSGRRAC